MKSLNKFTFFLHTLKRKLILSIFVIVLVITAIGITGLVGRSSHAAGSYNNADIVTIAEKYVQKDANGNIVTGMTNAPGSKACEDAHLTKTDSGSECRGFVNCVVFLASGRTQVTGNGDRNNYFSGFANSAVKEKKVPSQLTPGDVVQVGQYGLHTFIIKSVVSANDKAGTFDAWVIDSNEYAPAPFNHPGTVSEYERKNRDTLDGMNIRAFQMGTLISNSTSTSSNHTNNQTNTNSIPLGVFNSDLQGGLSSNLQNSNGQGLQNTASSTSLQGTGAQNNTLTTTSVIAGNPAALARDSGDMDVFYRTNDNKLVNKGWNVNRGWITQQLANNIAGNPIAILRGSGDMEIFYRTTDGNVGNLDWNASSGWHSYPIPSGNITGDPTVLSRTSDSMDLFVRNTSNDLVNYSWNAAQGWYGSQTLVSGDLTSNPVAIARSSTAMNVFYRSSNGHLSNKWWDASVGWNTQDLQVAISGDPDPLTRTSSNMDVFYRDPNNRLTDRWWDANLGWNTTSWNGNPTGDSSVVARTPNNMDVLFRENAGNIKEEWWDAKVGWNASGNYANDAAGDPVVVSRSSDNLEVFYRSTSSTLKDINWTAATGWHYPSTP